MTASLHHLLEERFRLPSFRPHQEDVCRSVVDGDDVLLVMPTGAGKSLCYQLPGLARGGTTLVISPLIALMEDQVAKLQALGLAAERIHSGRDRLTSRQVCRRYLSGDLDYLFIAPERLSVPGFPEMLAKRPPTLIAIDEAHCISQWGHDFRPDYRLLGQRLPLLRPAPMIALTATATAMVQRDITVQLGTPEARRFIHGFRRTNIAIEVLEAPPSARADLVLSVLDDDERRPAIVYAPTRKETESLAAALGELAPASAYHAGMTPDERDRVQAEFLTGSLEIIVATIAFGMGVDKADVRTIVHTALPGSLEGYYQEIGRAGRDGLPSRALLLWSWADRRTHEFFHQRDYPEPRDLDSVFRALSAEPLTLGQVASRVSLEDDVLEKALEKLSIHGGAEVASDPVTWDALFTRGEAAWKRPYAVQRDHKTGQLGEMVRFAQGKGCRMVHLVEHFGDQEDARKPCGLCDVCSPDDCLARSFRAPDVEEQAILRRILGALGEWREPSTGQLFRQVGGPDAFPPIDRKSFERLLGGLARSGLVEVFEDSFEKDGEVIFFARVRLTGDGNRAGVDDVAAVRLTDPIAAKGKGKGKKARRSAGSADETSAAPLPEAAAPLVEALEEWRRDEARRRKVPAYVIFNNKTLEGIARRLPRSEKDLLAVPGIGAAKAEQYGPEVLRLVRELVGDGVGDELAK